MTFHMPRRRDEDGLIAWLKPVFDGLQDAGVITNDSALTIGRVEQVTGKKAAGRKMVLTIEEICDESRIP